MNYNGGTGKSELQESTSIELMFYCQMKQLSDSTPVSFAGGPRALPRAKRLPRLFSNRHANKFRTDGRPIGRHGVFGQ